MSPRIAVIGDIAADTSHTPAAPAGAAAIAIALARQGAEVTLRAVCGRDATGKAVLSALERHGIPLDLVDRASEPTTAIVGLPDRGAGIIAGASLHKGARMDIYALFGHDAVVLDGRDQPLRRLLSDLPAHTVPAVRLIGTLTHLDVEAPAADELEVALRFDALVGTARQLQALTGARSADEALASMRARLPGTHLRGVVAIVPDAIHIVEQGHGAAHRLPRHAPSLPDIVAHVAITLASRRSLATLAEPAAPAP